jgi:hypothetical protein
LHATSLLFRLKKDLFEYIKIKDLKRQFFLKKADRVSPLKKARDFRGVF